MRCQASPRRRKRLPVERSEVPPRPHERTGENGLRTAAQAHASRQLALTGSRVHRILRAAFALLPFLPGVSDVIGRVPTLPRYSLGEEVAHSVIHGVGIVLAIGGLTTLVAFAALKGTAWHVVGCAIFGATLVLAYTASTLYHAIPATFERAKLVLRVLDHASIYLLIAGTYTPFCLVNLRGAWGWSLFGVVWGLAVVGVVFKALLIGRWRVLSVAFYVLLGWLVIVAARPLAQSVAPGGLVLLFAGGLAYTGGVAFYAAQKLPYHHAVWHLCVLAGSILHFFAVLLYVVPLAK